MNIDYEDGAHDVFSTLRTIQASEVRCRSKITTNVGQQWPERFETERPHHGGAKDSTTGLFAWIKNLT